MLSRADFYLEFLNESVSLNGRPWLYGTCKSQRDCPSIQSISKKKLTFLKKSFCKSHTTSSAIKRATHAIWCYGIRWCGCQPISCPHTHTHKDAGGWDRKFLLLLHRNFAGDDWWWRQSPDSGNGVRNVQTYVDVRNGPFQKLFSKKVQPAFCVQVWQVLWD